MQAAIEGTATRSKRNRFFGLDRNSQGLAKSELDIHQLWRTKDLRGCAYRLMVAHIPAIAAPTEQRQMTKRRHQRP
jgi:hypothetical protein